MSLNLKDLELVLKFTNTDGDKHQVNKRFISRLTEKVNGDCIIVVEGVEIKVSKATFDNIEAVF
jgi:hypothetical protein